MPSTISSPSACPWAFLNDDSSLHRICCSAQACPHVRCIRRAHALSVPTVTYLTVHYLAQATSHSETWSHESRRRRQDQPRALCLVGSDHFVRWIEPQSSHMHRHSWRLHSCSSPEYHRYPRQLLLPDHYLRPVARRFTYYTSMLNGVNTMMEWE